ncbi:MAG: methyltransferase domain-containing protein [Myxococcota bacterium]
MTTDTLFWDNIAERYAAKPVANQAAYERKLEVTNARLTSSDVVLDIGCGTGSLALEIAPQVERVHALDFSPEMIRIGKSKAAAQKVTNITFHANTLEGVQEFAPGQFDGICAYNILHLVEDRQATLDRVFELLKPGGFFISSNPCLGESMVPYRPVLAVMRWFGKAPPVALMTREGCLEEIRDAGFVDVAATEVGAAKTVAFVVATKPR